MKTALDLQNDKIGHLFFRYLFPAIASGMVTSLYIIVDGIFIGQGIGSQGLAAVGLVVPMFTMFSGLSLIFGIGGSTHSAFALARKQRDKAHQYFTQSILGITVIMGLFTLSILLFQEHVLMMLGAKAELLELSKTYLNIMIIFGIPYALSLVLSMFVRVEGFPNLAMIATVIGAVTNVLLDYIFIFPLDMGIFGAGLATGFGNIIATLILMFFVLKKKGQLRFVKPERVLIHLKQIFSLGLPNFMTQMLVSVVIVLYNIRLLELVGDIGVSAYSAVGFLSPLTMMFFIGVSQAVQPLVSSNFGCGQNERAKEVVVLGLKMTVLFGLIFLAAGFGLDEWIVSLFIHSTDPAYAIAVDALTFYFSSYIFAGIVIVLSAYFQSIDKPRFALYLSLLRGCVILLPLMYILSFYWSVDGLWYAVILTEIITAGLSLYLFKRYGSIYSHLR